MYSTVQEQCTIDEGLVAEASSVVDCCIAQECDDVRIIYILSLALCLEWSCKRVPGNK